jgi:phosphatidate cytidylyltransferase
MAAKTGAFNLRLMTAIVILPLLGILIWAPPLQLAYSVSIALLAGIGLFEYYAIARRAQIVPETAGGILAGTLVALSGHRYDPSWTAMVLCSGCLFVATLHVLRGRQSVAGLAGSVFGVVYVGWFAAHMVLLRGVPRFGPGLVTLLVVEVALSDAGAYLTGTTVGRHKMAPRLSPNKTWEGAVGGFVFTLAGAALFYLLSTATGWEAFPNWGLPRYLYIGAILSLVGQVGDLAESSLKRSAGVKDSGALFPGHGGVLDRGDGYLFAAPVLYYMVTALFHV